MYLRPYIIVAVLVTLAGAPSLGAQSTPPPAPRASLLPGTRPSVLASIQGHAVNASNGPVANTLLRLRDARYGRIAGTTTTDRTGLFAFRGLDPGSYVVEMMNASNDAVVAATSIINVAGGDRLDAVVKMPVRSPLEGVLGPSTTSAVALATAATAAGVLAREVAGTPATDRTPPKQ